MIIISYETPRGATSQNVKAITNLSGLVKFEDSATGQTIEVPLSRIYSITHSV